MADVGGEGGAQGIIVFSLWYIFIAYNYIMAPIYAQREKDKKKCHCRRAPCDSKSNSCDLPPFDIADRAIEKKPSDEVNPPDEVEPPKKTEPDDKDTPPIVEIDEGVNEDDEDVPPDDEDLDD